MDIPQLYLVYNSWFSIVPDGRDLRALLVGSGAVVLSLCFLLSPTGSGSSPNRSVQAPPGGCFLVNEILYCYIKCNIDSLLLIHSAGVKTYGDASHGDKLFRII